MPRSQRPPVAVLTRIPATTSNLGPGFDTLGIALKLYNRVRLSLNNSSFPRFTSPLSPSQVKPANLMAQQAARLFFQQLRLPPRGFDIALEGDIPIARGLGSSVTLRLGVLAGLDALCQTQLPRNQILDWLASLEHHPDNAAPAVLGGFTCAGLLGNSVRSLAFPVPSHACFVTLIPNFEISTEMARKLLPASYRRADTVHNLNRAALITAAFASGRLESLAGLFDDRVHQPYRAKLIPELDAVIQAGTRAGAIGGWLSGSGSTIICLTLKSPADVAQAMLAALPNSQVHILKPENQGYRVFPRTR